MSKYGSYRFEYLGMSDNICKKESIDSKVYYVGDYRLGKFVYAEEKWWTTKENGRRSDD